MRVGRHAIRTRRRNAILEHASHVLGSGLGKIGQAGGRGSPGETRTLGGAGRGALICPGARGVGRWSAPPSAPANPEREFPRA